MYETIGNEELVALSSAWFGRANYIYGDVSFDHQWQLGYKIFELLNFSYFIMSMMLICYFNEMLENGSLKKSTMGA